MLRYISGLIVVTIGLLAVWYQRKFNKMLAFSTAKQTRINEARRMKEDPIVRRTGTCVILGAGVAGSLSAAIASRHFEKVVLVDPIPTEGEVSNYIAQADQLHNFGPLSYEAFTSAWPNGEFLKVFKSFGGRITNSVIYAYQFMTFAGPVSWNKNVPGIVDPKRIPEAITITRRRLHDVLRFLIKEKTPNTSLIIGKAVQARFSQTGVHASDVSVESIQVQHKDREQLEWIDCSMLIDCSGSQRVFRKLISKDSRFSEPKPDKYAMNVTYNTAIINIHPSILDKLPVPKRLESMPKGARSENLGIMTLINSTFTDSTKYFIIGRLDSNKLALSTMDYSPDAKMMPANTLDSFQESLCSSLYTMTGKDAEPWMVDLMEFLRENEDLIEERVKFRKLVDSESYSYNFENIPKENRTLPNNLILLGDTYTKLNPAFGQGSQKASGEAMTLHSALLDNQPTFASSEKGKGSCAEVVNSFNNSRHHWSNRMFLMNRALDLSQPSVRAANPQLTSEVGEPERKMVKTLWNYLAKTGDKEMGALFWGTIMINSIPPAMMMHPYYLVRLLYAKYFL